MIQKNSIEFDTLLRILIEMHTTKMLFIIAKMILNHKSIMNFIKEILIR